MCSQPMVQAAQAARATRWASFSTSPEMASAPSNCPAWKFRVGSAFRRLNVSRLATVPSSRYFAVAGPKERADRSFAAATTPAGSATWRARACREPPTAFRFFDPRTAPSPPRPAWRLSWLIVAKRTRFSPAGPMTAKAQSGPKPLAEPSVASGDSRAPQVAGRFEADRAVVDHQHARVMSARPAMTRASKPVFLPSMAKCDDERASLKRSVSGDLATTANLADVVSGVPTSGLKTNTSGFSGASGSTPRGHSRCSSHAARPDAADEPAQDAFRQRDHLGRAGRCVDPQVTPVIAEHHPPASAPRTRSVSPSLSDSAGLSVKCRPPTRNAILRRQTPHIAIKSFEQAASANASAAPMVAASTRSSVRPARSRAARRIPPVPLHSPGSCSWAASSCRRMTSRTCSSTNTNQ